MSDDEQTTLGLLLALAVIVLVATLVYLWTFT